MQIFKSNFCSLAGEEFCNWLKDNKMKITEVNANQILIFSDRYCIKIYDCLGHGKWSLTVNVAKSYNEELYENDFVNLYWILNYYKIKNTSSFVKRTIEEYSENIKIVISELQSLIVLLNKEEIIPWEEIGLSANTSAKKMFTNTNN